VANEPHQHVEGEHWLPIRLLLHNDLHEYGTGDVFTGFFAQAL
jgi:hypothetical protein